jgi:hypothetical protein
MQMPQLEVAWRRREYNAAKFRLSMEIKAKKAGKSDPEEYNACRLRRLRLHLLAADPQL